MSTLEKVMMGMLMLVGIYIVINSRGNFNNVIKTIGANVTNWTTTLQGRGSSGNGLTVAMNTPGMSIPNFGGGYNSPILA